MLEGLPRTWLLTKSISYEILNLRPTMKTSPLFPPPSCDLHTGSGIGASFWFHQSHLPMLLHPLRHRGCLFDITGALFCSLGTCCGWFLVSPSFCVLFQSAFLHVFVTKWHFTYLVDPTIASLTPLLSWLKGAPPGINLSSRQQKKIWPLIGYFLWNPFVRYWLRGKPAITSRKQKVWNVKLHPSLEP